MACCAVELQFVTVVPASQVDRLYTSKTLILPPRSRKGPPSTPFFPLSADHLITLLQYNALRALSANRTLISGILTTPLDCVDEVIHTLHWPAQPELLPATLLPTPLQQTVPHGDWIDLFPCPQSRDHLIRAAGSFDEDELWADCIGGLYEGFPDDEMEKRGIIAWSPPWDVSGWEMSEGFLRKWGWLIQCSPGILVATNRWRLERGEEPLGWEDCEAPDS